MGIKEILSKHIYKSKYLKNRPDPRPTYIFPPGTYVAPVASNQQQPTCNSYCYQNYLNGNQNLQNRQDFGVGTERFQPSQHLYINENLHSTGSAYGLGQDKSRRASAYSIRSFHSHGGYLIRPDSPEESQHVFLHRDASSQSIHSQYEPRESRSRTVRNDSRGAYAAAESENRFSDQEANASHSHHSDISASRSRSRSRSSAFVSPTPGPSEDIIVQDYNSFEKHVLPHQRFRRDPDGSMYNIYDSESAKPSNRNNCDAEVNNGIKSQISVPAFNGQLPINIMKRPLVPLNQLSLNQSSDRESEYIVIKGSVVYDSGYVYEQS